MDKAKILIVDDEANIRFILERSLQPDGYYIDLASDGREALQKINSTCYDLLLLDINIGLVDGIQVMNSLRKNGQDAVVIILSAHGTIESAVEALRLGAFDYLFKPARPEVIRQRVREGLQHRQQTLRRQRLLDQMDQLKETLVAMDEEKETTSSPAVADRFIRSNLLLIDLHHRSATIGDNLLALTTTEYNLLVSLVLSAPEPVSPRKLINEALNYDSEETEAREIVKWHIYHLRKKIEPDPENPKYIKTVRYKGYLWSGQ